MNLINGIHHSCEMREYTFMVLQEYLIIFHHKLRLCWLPKKNKKGFADFIWVPNQVDQTKLKWTKQTKMDWIKPKWIKYNEVDSDK